MVLLVIDAVVVVAVLVVLATIPGRRLARARRRLGGSGPPIVTWRRWPSRSPWSNAAATIGNAVVIAVVGALLVLWTAGWQTPWVPHALGLATLLALARFVAPALPRPVVFGEGGLATPEEDYPWARVRGSLWIWDGAGLQVWWRNYGEPDVQVLVDPAQREPLRALLRARFGDEADNSIDDRIPAASA